ncbi:hypothetical protein GGP41_001252 [Bipolaris sorokiniana]|uniref:Uncharacterized protein n=1 Tax=Cochliobolus sativus TaxID=45130 RepID=A0A8H6DR67_COCSA|nr:hypothetical protein GGP41_001252 [Bipolaris sorokiniana]
MGTTFHMEPTAGSGARCCAGAGAAVQVLGHALPPPTTWMAKDALAGKRLQESILRSRGGEETACDVKLHMSAPRRIRRAHGPLSPQGVFTVAPRVRWQRPCASPLWEIGEPYLLLPLPRQRLPLGPDPVSCREMHTNTPN